MDMRRILSLVLAIAMLVSLCPTQAFAAEVEGSAPVSGDTVTETPAESEDVLEEETHPVLTMGTWSAVELSEGGTAYFTFTPEVTCTYKCWASADTGVSCSIYDTAMNLLGAGSNIENIHSYYSVEMTAGQTYILGFRYADGNKAGSFEVSVIHTNASYNVTREQ